MLRQKTLGGSFTLEGKGLHTGLPIRLNVHPAPADTGYRVKRIDLAGQPEIQAIAENVTQTVRGTVISEGDVKVSTLEHALSALYAAGIDNCLLEVNAPEFPILDGSASAYIKEMNRVGTKDLDFPKKFIEITEEIRVTNENGSEIVILPNEGFELEVEIGFNSSVLPNQKSELIHTEDFAQEISGARTFVFVREIEPLLKMNLIKGGDLQNAIVIYDKEMPQEEMDLLTDKLNQPEIDATQLGYLSGPLQWENEPARHKLLDLIGDLALTGHPLKAKIVARYPGHQINTEAAKLIRQVCLPK